MSGDIRRVRAVVVTYENAAFVTATLEALLATRWRGELEVVVVDNASTDGTADLVAQTFPTVRLVRSGTNRGFGGGVNRALAELDAVDAVALVNSDAQVEPDWLAPLASALERDTGLGAACPKIVFAPRFV